MITNKEIQGAMTIKLDDVLPEYPKFQKDKKSTKKRMSS